MVFFVVGVKSCSAHMVVVEIDIVNKLGLHARAAARFVTLASSFDSEIKVARGSRCVNGKSIMGVMMLAAGKGMQIEVTADGNDETVAIEQLQQLVAQRFGEEE